MSRNGGRALGWCGGLAEVAAGWRGRLCLHRRRHFTWAHCLGFPYIWQQSGQVNKRTCCSVLEVKPESAPTGCLTVVRVLRAISLLSSRTLRLTLMYSDVHRCCGAWDCDLRALVALCVTNSYRQLGTVGAGPQCFTRFQTACRQLISPGQVCVCVCVCV